MVVEKPSLISNAKFNSSLRVKVSSIGLKVLMAVDSNALGLVQHFPQHIIFMPRDWYRIKSWEIFVAPSSFCFTLFEHCNLNLGSKDGLVKTWIATHLWIQECEGHETSLESSFVAEICPFCLHLGRMWWRPRLPFLHNRFHQNFICPT